MTRKRPDIQACGERHEPYLHCLTCNPIPPENPDKLRGPEVGARVVFRLYAGGKSLSDPEGLAVVTARSYVWAPGDPSYHGGARHYDWKVIRFIASGKTLCVDDKDLEEVSA